MSERRFVITELRQAEDADYPDYDWDEISESELKRRILMLTGGDYREGDIDILLYGGDWPVKESQMSERRLMDEAHKLAMRVLQSDFYAKPDVKETVDNILAIHGEPEKDWPGPEDILEMRGKEQPDEWEAWVQRMPMMTAFRGEWQQWFREMPPRGK